MNCKSIAIAAAAASLLAATGAWADNWLWTGATDNIWSKDANWSKDGNNNVNRKFEEASFSEKFKTDYGYRVQFTGNESINWKAHIRTGTSEKPVVFYADDPSHGLKVNKSDGGWYVGYDSCASGEAWLKLESGTYETTGYWQIGYTDTGHLIVGEGATVSGTDFFLRKGSVTIDGGTVIVPSGNWTRFGSHGASTLNLNGGTFATKHIHKDANAPIINFNGGTLLANAGYASNGGLIQSGIAVNVLAGGGKIDNGGFDVTISAAIGGSGRLTFTGAGKTTLNGFTTIGNELAVDEGGVYFPVDMYVGNDSGLTAVLTVNGGTMEVDSGKWLHVYGGSAINLNGGVLKTQHIQVYSSATLNFNGGTLKASKASGSGLVNSAGTVNANGGTIDSGNFAISIPATLSGTGGLTFIGGNTITLGGSINYSGITGVAPGTTIKASNSKVSSILSKGIALVGVPALNTPYTILTSDEDLSSLTLDNVTCPIASAFTADFADEGKSVVVTVAALNPGWYVGPADGDLSVAANWSDGVVPTTGNAAISCVTKATLTKGASFAPTSITFGAGSAPVTINGDTAFENVTEVVSLSSSSHTINVPVRFTGDIQVKQAAMAEIGDLEKPHVTFAGGAYAAAGHALESGSADAVYSRCIFGKYHLASTAENRWEAPYQGSGKRRVCVADGASLYIAYAGALKELYVGKGAKVDIGDWNTDARSSYQIHGEIVATNLMESGSGDRFMSWNQGTTTPGVFKFESVTNAMTGNWWVLGDQNAASKHVYYIGAGGLNFSGTAATYCIGVNINGNHETIRPWHSDFTIAGRGDGGRALVFRQTVEFCTDDESGTGRTITIDAVTRGNGTPAVIVSGSGTLKVNRPASNDQHPSVTLADTVTLEYAADATLGTGAVTLGADTTFAFENSGSTLSLPAPIVLPDTGVATLRIGGGRLRDGEHALLASAPVGGAAHLAIDPTSPALDGRRFTVAEKDGALLLDIASSAFIMVIR